MRSRRLPPQRPPPAPPKPEPGRSSASNAVRWSNIGPREGGGQSAFAGRLVVPGEAHPTAVTGLASDLQERVRELFDLGLLTGPEIAGAVRLPSSTPKLRQACASTEAGRAAAGQKAESAVPRLTQPAHAKAGLLDLRQAVVDRAQLIDPVLAALREELKALTPAALERPPTWQLRPVPPAILDFTTLRGLLVARLVHDPGLRTRGYLTLRSQHQHWVEASSLLTDAAQALAAGGEASALPALIESWGRQAAAYKRLVPRGAPFPSLTPGADAAAFLKVLSAELATRQTQTDAERDASGARLRGLEDQLLRELISTPPAKA